MFKMKFEESLNSHPLKANISKAVRDKIIKTYPKLADYMETIWPKNAKTLQLKIKTNQFSHMSFY